MQAGSSASDYHAPARSCRAGDGDRNRDSHRERSLTSMWISLSAWKAVSFEAHWGSPTTCARVRARVVLGVYQARDKLGARSRREAR
jgi:hypothetical protein